MNNGLKSISLEVLVLKIFLYISPWIDIISGIFINNNSVDSVLPKIFRFIFFIFLFIILLLTSKRKNVLFIIMLFVAVTFLPLIYAVLNMTCDGIMVDEQYMMKLFFPIVLILCGEHLHRRGRNINFMCKKLIIYYSIFYPFSIVIPYFLNIGFSTYKGYEQSGYIGLYGYGNEISIVLAIVFTINVGLLIEKKSWFNFFMIFVSIFASIITGTKSAIIVIFLTLIYVIIRNRDAKKVAKSVIMISGIVFIVYMTISKIFIVKYHNFLDRLLFKYNQLGNSVIDFLFSKRNTKLVPCIYLNYFNSSNGFLNLIFGRGFYFQTIGTLYKNRSLGLIEMDFFDILLQNGLFLFLIIFGFYINILKYKNINNMFRIYRFSYFIMLLFSFMAGHVLYNPVASTLFAVLAMTLVNYNEKESKKE